MPWTVPALRVDSVSSRYSVYTISPYRNVVSRVRIRQLCDKQNDGASCVTDFNRSAEFSRNFGLKVICVFCYIKLMLSSAEQTQRNLVS